VESITDDSTGVAAVFSAASGHLVFETAIDLTQSALQVSPDSTFGLRVFYALGSFGIWPPGSNAVAPVTFADITLGPDPGTASETLPGEIPETFVLENFPNPFNPQTTIRFGLPTQERVTLAIYNVLGEKIATLIDHALKAAGYHTVVWDGRNRAGHRVASGLYFYTLQSEHHRTSQRMVLVK